MTARTSRKKQTKKSIVDTVDVKNCKEIKEEEIEDTNIVDDESKENQRLELIIRFPKLKCYKKALMDLVETDKPICLTSNVSFTTVHNSRSETESAVEKLKDVKIGTESIRVRLSQEGDSIPKRRVLLVPRRAHYKEAVQVLKKTYGAKEVDCTKKGIDNHVYTMDFETEEEAVKAETQPHVMYHGLELIVGAAIGPKKRPLEVTPVKENPVKKQKTGEANGETKADATDDETKKATNKNRNKKQAPADEEEEDAEEEEEGDDGDKEGGEEDMDEDADDDAEEDDSGEEEEEEEG